MQPLHTFNIGRLTNNIKRVGTMVILLSLGLDTKAQTPSFDWSKRIASTINSDDELAVGMAMDSLANLYVTGWFDGTNDFGGVTLTNQPGGGQDIFVAKYNAAGTLQWARRAGDSTAQWNTGRGVGVDSNANVYVTGGFHGVADFGTFTLTATQYHDFFLAKYDAAGSAQWVRQSAGGGDSAYGTGLAVDASGNSYSVGYFEGTSVKFGSTTLTNKGDYSIFLVKYDTAGTVQWAKAFSSSAVNSTDQAYSTKIAIDTAGNIVMGASFIGTVSVGNSNFVSAGGKDLFVAKFNSAGVFQWARQVGGTGDETAESGVATDASNNIFISGAYGSSPLNFGGNTLTNAGQWDAFIAKYNSAGTLQWVRHGGGTGLEWMANVSTDAQGNPYAVGLSSANASFGGLSVSNRGGFDVTVVKYDANGTVQWTQSAGGTSSDLGWDILADSVGNLYLDGWFQSPATFATNTLTGSGAWNFFLARLGTNALPTNHYATESIAGYTVAVAITNINGTPIPAASATNVYGVSTFSQIGPNADNTYSGNYTYVKTGTNTGTIFIHKTAPPDQAGETTTNYLVFTSPLNGTFAHHYDFDDTPPTVQYGTFQVVQTNGLTGSLQVSLSPAGAISAGAQWQVDGGSWQTSGNTVSNLTAGSHTVAYKPVSGWNTPNNQTVAVTAGTTTLTNGIYTPQTGSLQVAISPAGAISAGAQWQVDGGAWQNSGASVSNLTVGNHTVAYKTISGWNTPTNQTVLVVVNTTTATNGVYVQQTGSLLVTIDPADAVAAGAQWQVDGGAWQNSGAVVSGLSPGYHWVSFNNISNWYAPSGISVLVAMNSTATANKVYVPVGQPVIPAPIQCALSGNSLNMAYPTALGQTYILQYTDDLTPPVTWRALTPFIGTGSGFNIVVPTASPTRYFRVRVGGGDSYGAVYSINIVGYVRRSIQPGLNLVANPLNSCGDNSIGSLFPNCPPNSEILLPDPSGSLAPGSVFSGGAWDPPNLILLPGQGIGLVNPGTPFEVIFAGEVVYSAVTSIPPGLSLIGSKVPVNGLLNFPAQDGDEITTWNATNQTSLLHDYFGGSWYPESPAIRPAEAFWVQVSQFAQWTQPLEPWFDSEAWDFPLMTRQPASRTNSPGSTAHFAVQAVGGSPLHYQWRKNGTNLLAAERIFGVNADTLALTNVQSADAGNYSVVITNSYGSVTSSIATLTVQLPAPLIITTNGNVGVSNGLFGFRLSGVSGQVVVTEAATNLANPVWVPLQTNVLGGTPAHFTDPQWTNYPGRFYRLRSP